MREIERRGAVLGQLFETEEARIVPAQRGKKRAGTLLAEGHSSFGTQIPIKCPREIYRLRSSYVVSAIVCIPIKFKHMRAVLKLYLINIS